VFSVELLIITSDNVKRLMYEPLACMHAKGIVLFIQPVAQLTAK